MKEDLKLNWICLNTPFVPDIIGNLNVEVDRLTTWINTYFIQKQVDINYDYLIFTRPFNSTMLFEENSADYSIERFNENNCGTFNVLYEKHHNLETFDLFFANDLGNKKSSWNTYLKNEIVKKQAFWIFLKKEPVKEEKTAITSIKELLSRDIISKEQYEKLKSFTKEIYVKAFKAIYLDSHNKAHINHKNYIYNILTAWGYLIPTKNGSFEVHWELAKLEFHKDKLQDHIEWGESKNVDKSRFFGRGGICPDFMNKHVLLLGCGAVGSSLAEILVRGGLNHISLCDNDTIDSGNLCRSTYSLFDYQKPKYLALKNRLERISPFVHVDFFRSTFTGEPYYTEIYPELISKVESFDLIIDCTASNQVLHFLSSNKLSKPVLSISITDKSQQLICLSNSGNSPMYEIRGSLLSSLGAISPPDYYEGAGCFYPTFHAGYFDINALLNCSIRIINNYLNQSKDFESFYLEHAYDGIVTVLFERYYQPELRINLVINSTCLDIMYENSINYHPNEFGGFLMGDYSMDGKNIFITNTLIPEKFNHGRAHFIADTESISKQIAEIHKKTDGAIKYLGDWHSHPEMSNDYSSVDKNSIIKQARSTYVQINNPILSIISVRGEECDVAFYLFYEGHLYKFFKVNE